VVTVPTDVFIKNLESIICSAVARNENQPLFVFERPTGHRNCGCGAKALELAACEDPEPSDRLPLHANDAYDYDWTVT
jgi:hypothetical protein